MKLMLFVLIVALISMMVQVDDWFLRSESPPSTTHALPLLLELLYPSPGPWQAGQDIYTSGEGVGIVFAQPSANSQPHVLSSSEFLSVKQADPFERGTFQNGGSTYCKKDEKLLPDTVNAMCEELTLGSLWMSVPSGIAHCVRTTRGPQGQQMTTTTVALPPLTDCSYGSSRSHSECSGHTSFAAAVEAGNNTTRPCPLDSLNEKHHRGLVMTLVKFVGHDNSFYTVAKLMVKMEHNLKQYIPPLPPPPPPGATKPAPLPALTNREMAEIFQVYHTSAAKTWGRQKP
ncbi:hypothetical protein BDK51DRAFT_32257 [Blyttiomyces helicus]|uniref:Uncharacterized protein n=1 Tax=Blyttiomyces helicus TaxID=388810 RepID=A0A4P9WLN6_9FUNG|nr:hypothetical protein BDK51DRAFT_32257 [Blyttiomyces helicus]|eukprot:RKO93961.1 hypothetical protein BDK51DRAFT_32257 [Blyttiomyces helicus]